MRLRLVAVACAPLIAHGDPYRPEIDARFGVLGAIDHYDHGGGAPTLANTPLDHTAIGPVVDLDGGVRLSPHLALLAFASVATFTDPWTSYFPGVQLRHWLVTPGIAMRVHWCDFFADAGLGRSELRSAVLTTFVLGSTKIVDPSQWAGGSSARLEFGYVPKVSHRISPEVALVASASWLSMPSVSMFPDASPSAIYDLELVVGLRY